MAAQDGGLVAEAATNSSTRRDLPDPGRAEDADQVAGPLGGRPLEQPQQLLLAAPADHGRDRPPGPARAVGQDLQQPPDLLRLGGALDRHRPGRLGLDGVGHQPVGLLAEQDLPGPGRLLEPLGQVDGGAGELLLQGAGVADEHVAGVDAERTWNSRPRWRRTSLASSSRAARSSAAARTARRASSSCSSGTPKAAMKPSPWRLPTLAPRSPRARRTAAVAVQEPLHGLGLELALQSVDLTTSQKTTVTIRNSWVESRVPTGWPHSGQKLARSTRPLPQFGHVAMAGVYGRSGRATVLLVTVPASGSWEFGYSKRRRLARLSPGQGPSEEWSGGAGAQAEPRDYEQALRRQELAAGRALVQALGRAAAGGRELAAAKRVLTQALFDLRRLGRDLDQEIEPAGPAGPRRAAQGSGPGELDRFEAVRNAVEVAERWEGRRDQLGAELDRRQRRPGAASRVAR